MAANVDYEFKNFFELNEERLRRIHSILKNRVNDSNSENINFRVTRVDNLVYITKNIDDIINEENDSVSKIISLEVYFGDESNRVSLFFKNKDGASMRITGSDRDNVFLLSSELKEYINKEVATIKNWNNLNFKEVAISSLIFISGFFLYKVKYLKENNESVIANALSSQDVNVKLDYIISHLSNTFQVTSPVLIMLLVTAFFIVTTSIFPISRFINYFFPRNLFLVGKQLSIIEKRRKTNSNIFWVVIVGGTISLLLAYFSPKIFA